MVKIAPRPARDAEDGTPRDLTTAERDALAQGEADLRAGRLHDHAEIAGWLRQRAAEITDRAGKAKKPG